MTKGRLVPNIESSVLTPPLHVEALDADWNVIDAQDFNTIEQARAYVAREHAAIAAVQREFSAMFPQMVVPIFTIDGEQYAPAKYSIGGGGDIYVMCVGDLRCAYRIRFDGVHVVRNRQPLIAGSFYPNAQALADALREVTA